MKPGTCPRCGGPDLPDNGTRHVEGCAPEVRWEARIAIGSDPDDPKGVRWGPWGPVPNRSAWFIRQRADVELRVTPRDFHAPPTRSDTVPLDDGRMMSDDPRWFDEVVQREGGVMNALGVMPVHSFQHPYVLGWPGGDPEPDLEAPRLTLVWGENLRMAEHRAREAGVDPRARHVKLCTPSTLGRGQLLGLFDPFAEPADRPRCIGWRWEDAQHARLNR